MDAAVALLEAVDQHAWPVAGVLVGLLLFRTRLVKALCWNIVLRVMRVPLEQRQAIITQVARKDFELPPSERPPDS
jgi:hypothetical protein